MPPPVLDASFLSRIRGLRSFTHQCDLDALALTAREPLEVLESLVRDGHLKKEEAGRLWSTLIGVAYVDPFAVVVTDAAVELIPGEIAKKCKVLPLYLMGETLVVVMGHPEDVATVESLTKIAKVRVAPNFGFPLDVTDLIRVHYSTELSVEECLRDAESHEMFDLAADFQLGGKQIAELAEAAEVVKFLNAVIFFAIRQNASDIHIEPQDGDGRVRLRIDGTLRQLLTFSKKLHPAVITRLKIMTQQNIAETRLPIDGRFSLSLGTTKVDFRFSSLPSQYGEKAVIRILGNANRSSLLNLDHMLISQAILTPYRRLMQSPHGIFFVTGPTGSGKTTTLYATLSELNETGVNVSTIEDPIELRLDGITQSQVEPAINLRFPEMLRSLLRQDPDILLIGEIRDLETAKIATEAALTGHLVLATLHTNSAPDAIIRLMEIGVDPYMIAPSVIGVLGQRLVPRICENCKEPYKPGNEVLRRYFDDEVLPDVTFFRGRGCHVCGDTGFHGRVAFHELLVIDREIRSLIVRRADPNDILDAAARAGYKPLRYDGLKKVLLGLTTIEEIEAQTPVDFAD
uniref:GspE/PulE family protein n=1 Tax=Cephaloticoccus sp. TaxID=1985742 RepID=UPI00404A9F55